MYKFVIKRLLLTLLVLIGVAFIVFTILALTPGDPGRLILGENAAQEDVDRLNAEFGLDRPFFVRFFSYIFNIVTRFDFDRSYVTGAPVFDEIWARFPITVRLAVLSILCSSVLGVSLGVLSAVKQYSLADVSSTITALFLAAMPGFWFSLMMIYVFALGFRILPSYGVANWKGYVLPVAAMTLTGSAGIIRLTRSAMLETIRMDYIRTARAKGAPEWKVIFMHALRNALMPIVTYMGTKFGALLGGTIVTETVFAIPGLGTHIINAIRQRNMPVVLASTLFLATLYCLIILLVDIIYAFLDPRVKARYMN